VKYRLEYATSVARDLKALPAQDRDRLVARMDALAEDPYPRDLTRLKGSLRGLMRVRVGDYRIGYEVTGDTVTVMDVEQRGQVYKSLRRRR